MKKSLPQQTSESTLPPTAERTYFPVETVRPRRPDERQRQYRRRGDRTTRPPPQRRLRKNLAPEGYQTTGVSAELSGLLSVGAALAGQMLAMFGWLSMRLNAIETRLGQLEERVGRIEEWVARIEGLIEGAGLFRPLDTPGRLVAAGD